MRLKKQNTIPIVLVAVIVLLLLPGMACNLLSAQPEEVVEEIIDVDDPEPEDEPEFRPEQVSRFDFEETVRSVAFTHDGERFATGTFRQVDFWNASSGELMDTVEELPHSVMGLAFAPDAQAFYGAFATGGVNLYSLMDGELMIDFHRGYDNNLALSPDGTRIATGNRSGETWVWNSSSGEQIYEMDPADHVDDYSEYLTALAFSPDGGILAAGHWDGYIFLWDANSGDLIRTIEPETYYCAAWSLAFSPDGQYLAVGGHNQEFDDVIKVFQVSDGGLAWVLDEYSRGGSMDAPVAFSADGTLLAAGATDGIYIWALPDFELLHTIPIEETDASDWVTDLAFSPDSQYLLAGYWDNFAILWQVQE